MRAAAVGTRADRLREGRGGGRARGTSDSYPISPGGAPRRPLGLTDSARLSPLDPASSSRPGPVSSAALRSLRWPSPAPRFRATQVTVRPTRCAGANYQGRAVGTARAKKARGHPSGRERRLTSHPPVARHRAQPGPGRSVARGAPPTSAGRPARRAAPPRVAPGARSTFSFANTSTAALDTLSSSSSQQPAVQPAVSPAMFRARGRAPPMPPAHWRARLPITRPRGASVARPPAGPAPPPPRLPIGPRLRSRRCATREADSPERNRAGRRAELERAPLSPALLASTLRRPEQGRVQERALLPWSGSPREDEGDLGGRTELGLERHDSQIKALSLVSHTHSCT